MADVTTRWTRIQTLFEQAIERPPDEQSAWLRAQCGEDPELYREVEALLEGDANQHTLFEGRVSDLLEPADFDAALTRSHDGERVGPWVLGERIGEGGMGAVYRADRADGGYDQTAALKLIKPGMDSEAVVARFRAERQILARLEHPGIARLLDGGLTDQGRPYFAMELVEGEPITAYADDRQLDVGARLRLFVTVCEAVRYAHRQLVVHRDLKPSNILVSPEGEVKLLDFGIARLLEDDSDLELTRTGQRMLTPSYAAPEQLRGEPPTTATDVYALGGLLYRLLCGAPPIDTEGRSVAEVELAVLNETPKRPSERVTMDVTRQRGASEDELAKRLRGDLDVICLKALEKDPERRYGSAGELLSDIQRHLEGQPIEARPATRRYRAGLFMKRHRAGVLGTAAAVIALVALTGFYTNRLANERDRAEAEADKAEQVSEFLQSLFGQASPTENEGRELTASEILALGAARIEEELADEPEVQATMFRVVGEVYRSLGKYDEAVQWGQKSVQLWTEIGPRDRPQRALALSALARAIQETGEFPTADSLHSEALAILRRTASADSEELVRGLEELSWLRQQQGQLDAAIELRRESVSILKEQAGENNRRTAIAMGNLANTLREKGDYEEAEPLFRRTLELYDKLFGPRNPETATVKNNLALMLNQQGRHADAVPLYREVLAIDQETLEPDHPYIAISQNNLGQALHGLGEYEESEQFFRAALALRREVLGPEHPATAESMHNLSQLLRDADRIEEAEALDRRAVELFEQALGPEHPRTALTTVYHGDLLRRLGRLEEADVVLRTATERIAAAFDSTHSRQSDPLVARAEWHLASGNADEGLRLALQAVAIRQRELAPDHPNLLLAEAIHAEALAATGDRAGAVRLFDDVIEQIIARDGAAHPRVRNLSARREALQNR